MIFLFASIMAMRTLFHSDYLVLVDSSTGTELVEFKLPASNTFSVSFIHSVNKSPIEEGYVVKNKRIYLDWCRYYTFGAGVATEISGNQKLAMNEDRSMVISGFNQQILCLTYVISSVYDHILTINGENINLTDRNLKNKAINFQIKRRYKR